MDRSLTLVLVDGHDQIRSALATGLRRFASVRLLAAVGEVESAVPVIETKRPQVVLFEPKTMHRPVQRSLPVLLATACPVVIWTSSLVDGEADMLLRSGATAVLLKEVRLAHLVHGLEAALGLQ